MILTDMAIIDALDRGDILIDPFDPKCLGPNSYDLHLGPTILTYQIPRDGLDPTKSIRTNRFTIPPCGMILMPGQLYLGSTVERAGSTRYVPELDGRSSWGRLGMSVHLTAGRGDIGWLGHWTLEITVVHPLVVRAGDRLAQVYFHEVLGTPSHLYGKGIRGHHYDGASPDPVGAAINPSY